MKEANYNPSYEIICFIIFNSFTYSGKNIMLENEIPTYDPSRDEEEILRSSQSKTFDLSNKNTQDLFIMQYRKQTVRINEQKDIINELDLENKSLRDRISDLREIIAGKDTHIFFRIIEVVFGFLGGAGTNVIFTNLKLGIILLLPSVVFIIIAIIYEIILQNKYSYKSYKEEKR